MPLLTTHIHKESNFVLQFWRLFGYHSLRCIFSFAVYKGVEPFSSDRQSEIIAVIPINQITSVDACVLHKAFSNFTLIVIELRPLTVPYFCTSTKTQSRFFASTRCAFFYGLPFYLCETIFSVSLCGQCRIRTCYPLINNQTLIHMSFLSIW